MDPNANLTEQRKRRRELTDLTDRVTADDIVDRGLVAQAISVAERLVLLDDAMDDWISSGGFLPAAWTPAAVRTPTSDIATAAVASGFAEQPRDPLIRGEVTWTEQGDVPPVDSHLFRLREVAAVTEERADDLDATQTNDEEHDAASALRDAARELVLLVRWMDEHLTAGVQPPMDWRPELTSPEDGDLVTPRPVEFVDADPVLAGQVHVRVTYRDGTDAYYPVPPGEGWRIDTTRREVVIGKGLGRVHIPLDVVWSYSPEPCGPHEHERGAR